jgi:hypothetical protein
VVSTCMLERISRVRPFEQGSSQMELREIGEIGEMAISSHQWQSPLNRGRRKWSSARLARLARWQSVVISGNHL